MYISVNNKNDRFFFKVGKCLCPDMEKCRIEKIWDDFSLRDPEMHVKNTKEHRNTQIVIITRFLLHTHS